jgi:hypothetical protein
MVFQSRSHASSTAARNSALRHGQGDSFGEDAPVDVPEPVELRLVRRCAAPSGRVEVGEQGGELGADVGAVGVGVVEDEVLEEVLAPHVGVVAEHQEEDPGEGDGDLVVALGLGVDAGVGLLHGGVQAGHELGGVLGLVLCLDVEGLADLGQDGVAVEGDVEGEADDVELVGEAGVGVAGAVPVAAEPGGGGVAGGAAHGPAPDLFVLVVEDQDAVGAGAGEVPVEFGFELGVGLLVDDPDADALVLGDVGGGDVPAVVLDGDRRLVGAGPVQVVQEQLLVVVLLGAFDEWAGHASWTPSEQTILMVSCRCCR